MRSIRYEGSDSLALHATVVDRRTPPLCDPPTLIMLHGGGPDRRSLLPLANRLADLAPVVVPDVRGYGQSVCTEPERHTWTQYVEDVLALMDRLELRKAILGGAGLGSTIALRTAVARPERVSGLILISVEDIEDDEAKRAEIAFMDAFAERVRTTGIESAWAPILPQLAPVIGAMVRDAIPRSDPESIAAATAIGRDRSFRSLEELAGIHAPAIVFPGMDHRHPPALAEAIVRLLLKGRLGTVSLSSEIRTQADFANAFAPAIREFMSLDDVNEFAAPE